MTQPEDALTALRALADGLLWPSESDYPIEVQILPEAPVDLDMLLRSLGLPAHTAVEQRTVYQLFANVCREHEWMDEEARAKVQHFIALRDALLGRLRNPVAYRVGEIDITLLVIGQDSTDRWLCLRTTAIET
jgi:hypothetical protein